MTALQPPLQPPLETPARSAGHRLRWTFVDGWILVKRILTHLKHSPGQLITLLIFPAIMVVLFGYVLGSSIVVPGGGNYREYLMPGLFVMTGFTGVMAIAGRVAADVGRGVMDRFRAIPMARSAVMFGQTGADLIIGVLSSVVMMACGFAAGWRIHNGPVRALEAFALIVLMRYAVSWLGVCLGLRVKDEETAANMVPLIFPLTMISNSFVPADRMPSWLRPIAEWNPVSSLVAACRQLFGNPGQPTRGQAWPLLHPVTATLLWSVALLVVFVPAAIRIYRTPKN
ncbi:ABC transporter permease [Actinomadura harenae]|uniref:Transport permease protein n=1 Tax=Actinomadura harenae TaxID=2483351 RepID=A0A3M2M308_9ACTN|nr:ABC transporter permease [Actinomadura harenae]RMI43183.1 ABC transporter permease [Actinomadura harenae]